MLIENIKNVLWLSIVQNYGREVNENEHVLVKVSKKVILSIYDFERIMLFKCSRKSYLASIQVTGEKQ